MMKALMMHNEMTSHGVSKQGFILKPNTTARCIIFKMVFADDGFPLSVMNHPTF